MLIAYLLNGEWLLDLACLVADGVFGLHHQRVSAGFDLSL